MLSSCYACMLRPHVPSCGDLMLCPHVVHACCALTLCMHAVPSRCALMLCMHVVPSCCALILCMHVVPSRCALMLCMHVDPHVVPSCCASENKSLMFLLTIGPCPTLVLCYVYENHVDCVSKIYISFRLHMGMT